MDHSEIVDASGEPHQQQKNKNEPHSSPITIKSAERPNISHQETLDIDEVIRSLNDEYKKAKANPVRSNSLLLGKSKQIFASIFKKAKQGSCLESSLSLYTQSLSLAEDGSEELMWAYGERALLFLKLSLYDHFVADMQRAIILSEKYSNSWRDYLKNCLNHFYRLMVKMPPDQRPVVRSLTPTNNNPQGIAGINPEKLATVSADAEDREREWRDMCRLDNRCIQNASSKIRLGYDERKWGRFVEATEDLEAGEIIAVQEFFTAYLRPGLEFVRCSLCIAFCVALIPCPTCNVMMYCSEKCRDYAYELYHRLECRIMLLFFKEADVAKTKFRVVRQLLIGTDQGFKLAKLMDTMTIRDIMKTDFPPSEIFKDEYETALRLHESYARDQVEDFVPFVGQMIETLEHVGFFETSDQSLREKGKDGTTIDGTMTEAQIFTAFLLLNHIVGMDKYFFDIQIYKFVTRGSKPTPNDDKTIAAGFCTFFPVFNHSCDANVFVMPRNLQAAFITRRPIRKGQEITISYAFDVVDCDFECQCDVHDSELYPPKMLRAKPQFHSHVIPEVARVELWMMLMPVADLQKSMSLSPKEILRIVVDVCKWLYTNIKYVNSLHIDIQPFVSFFMKVFYGMFNEHILREDAITEGYYSCWLKIIDELDIDLQSASE